LNLTIGWLIYIGEFCQTVNNDINLDDEEIPKEDTYDYVLSPSVLNQVSNQETNIIFVLDMSGMSKKVCISVLVI
jgi:hypothetical protein